MKTIMNYIEKFALISFVLTISHQTMAAQLQIKIENVETTKGSIFVAVDNTKQGYGDDTSDTAVARYEVTPKVPTTVIETKNLPAGNYTVSIFHDLDNDEELDTNLFGAPTEAYGFSNNIRKTFGSPSFEESLFSLGKEDKTIMIKIEPHF